MSILVETAVAIADALNGNEFEYGPFTASYDFEGRQPLEEFIENLSVDKLVVRVIVPERFTRVERWTRAPSLRYLAAYDVDVVYRLGSKAQAADTPDLGLDVLAKLTSLVEDVHHFFFLTSDVLGDDEDLQWVANDDELGVISEIKVPYSAYFLAEHRIFYGLCREYFWKVR